MSLSLIILLTILIIFLICFIYMEPIISKHKIKNNNEYGSARFSTFNEINKNFTKEKISNINEVGFLLIGLVLKLFPPFHRSSSVFLLSIYPHV